MTDEEAQAIANQVKQAKAEEGIVIGGKLKRISVDITVHRAATNKDEHIGLVSFYHTNPLIHYPVNLMIWLRGRIRLWQMFLRTKVKK